MSKNSPATAFTPAAPAIIQPSASDIAEHAPPSRARQTPAAARKGHELTSIDFPRGVDHKARHLELLGDTRPLCTGFSLHVVMFIPPEVTRGNIIVPHGTRREYRYQGKVGLVVGMGPDCYDNKKDFPSGPYCKLHDWIIFPAYGDTNRKFTWNNRVDIIVMDDRHVDAVIDDPVLVT